MATPHTRALIASLLMAATTSRHLVQADEDASAVGNGIVVDNTDLPSLKQKPFAASTSSDIVALYRSKHIAGEKLDPTQKRIPKEPPSGIAAFLAEHKLSWSQVPELLQAALLWDFGYVFAEGAYKRIYTACGETMEKLAVSIDEFVAIDDSSYTALDCSKTVRQQQMAGTLLYPIVKCAAEDINTPMHSSMWIAMDMSQADQLPTPYPVLGRHAYDVENERWLIYSIHVGGEGVKWGTCPGEDDVYGLVIPCVSHLDDPKDRTWCAPERSAAVMEWITQVKSELPDSLATGSPSPSASTTGSSTQKSDGADDDSSSATIYIVVAVVLLLFLLAVFFVWRRNRKKANEQDGIDLPQPHHGAGHGEAAPHQAYREHYTPQEVLRQPRVEPAGAQRPDRAHLPMHMRGQQPNNAFHPDLNGAGAKPHARQGPGEAGVPKKVNFNKDIPEGGAPKKQAGPTERSREVATRVLAEIQADEALSTRRIPYSALYFTRVLSKGAFGEVWLAQLENRQVAVKRILNEKKHEEKEIECFAAEIKLMASFHHPKIVEFVGVSWSTLQDLCAITEYMAKGDLYMFLKKKNGQLNWRDHKIYLAEDVADAICYLHSLQPKVIHRDLKSKNILLDETFRAKLSDFGISRERSLEETMTAGVGTIYWTAPEVLMGKKYTEKADIYSFGIVMSELDTHHVPYSDKCDDAGKKLQGMKIVQKVIRQRMRPTFTPHCPSAVLELAKRCLDANPDLRPDASELLQIIIQLQNEL